MLVITASTGVRYRNDASDSSASATRKSPSPRRACASAASNRPPMTNVGSRPPSASTDAIRLVVVVLPCVPAIAIPCFRRMSSASIVARAARWESRAARRGVPGCPPPPPSRRRSHPTVRIGSAMSDGDVDAQVAQAARRRTVDEVGPGDAVVAAARRKHLGNAAHAGAADADEVHVLDPAFQGASTLAPPARRTRRRRGRRRRACRRDARRAPSRASARQRTEETGQRRRRAGQFRLRQHDRGRTGIEQEACRSRSARRRSRRATGR